MWQGQTVGMEERTLAEKIKNRIVVLTAAVFFFGAFIWCLLKPAVPFSESERRPLEKMPSLSVSGLVSGKFMKDFESYSMDQFPMRNGFRTLKSIVSLYLLGQKDTGGIYLAEGYASKLEYPMNAVSLENAASRFRRIYEKYLKDQNVKIYLSIIPDKNFVLAGRNDYPAMDYEKFARSLREKTDYMQYIDIYDCLELADYYKTDTHWRQERIVDVAQRLAEGMGISLSEEYELKTLNVPFYGVYYGQSALPLAPEEICYLDSGLFDTCRVFDYETNEEISVYDMERAEGRDPYEMFIAGPKSLLVVQNESADTDRRLIIFRDSFGSSIAPLLFEGYSEITLIDIRYLSSELLGNFVEFDNADVLFLYSSLVLNNSETLK